MRREQVLWPFWNPEVVRAPQRRAVSPSNARVSQVVMETLLGQTSNARVSQVVLEVLCIVQSVQPMTHISM